MSGTHVDPHFPNGDPHFTEAMGTGNMKTLTSANGMETLTSANAYPHLVETMGRGSVETHFRNVDTQFHFHEWNASLC